MAKTSVEIVTLRHPLGPGGRRDFQDVRDMLEFKGFALKGHKAEGAIERFEFHKALDYNREERRAAAKSGQILEFNKYKGILPDGYVPIMPDDPRLAPPAPTN